VWLGKVADTIYRILSPLSKAVLVIGSASLTVIMLLTAADVCMRYFFDRPINGAFDLTEYLMVIVFSFALPYCTLKKEHIKVDILMSHLSEKTQAMITVVTAPLSLGLFSLVVWQSIVALQIQYDPKIVSSVLLIPRYPFLGLLFLGYVCFVIVLLADYCKLLSEVAKK